MCGIAGYISQEEPVSEVVLKKMCDFLKHRGPDGSGVWLDPASNIGLSHTRLAIIDLTKDGAQPMVSSSGRYVISYNGEIYNHQEIRKELSNLARTFKGRSDTESLIEAIEEWGVEKVLPKINGMFAFSIWDKKEKELWLVRDRLGIKPLYYGWVGRYFIFSSELKAFKAISNLGLQIDKDALCLFLRHNYIPAPYSIYKNVFKLEPGSFLKLDLKDAAQIPSKFSPYARNANSEGPKKFWDIREKAINGIENPFSGSQVELDEVVKNLISDSIKIRLMSDVPLGLFLSGGIDSSLVTLLASKISTDKVKTFTIGFHETRFNEAQYASEIAKHIGTDHTELYLTAKDALDIIPLIPEIYDEPFSDSSQIPTYLVSRMAREKVTVCLSGDGGDETFCGYSRYIFANKFWNSVKYLPLAIRKAISASVNSFSETSIDSIYHGISKVLPGIPVIPLFGAKAQRFFKLLCLQNRDLLYQTMVSHWENPTEIIPGSNEPLSLLQMEQYNLNFKDFREQMMYQDLITYLPDDLLTKVDRASMAVSLEARVPLIDYRLAELGLSIPANYKYKNGKSKLPLRNILYESIPKSLVDRPKQGFAVPVGEWLRSELREWAEDLLSERKLQDYGVFDYKNVKTTWDEHLSGRKNRQYLLWDVLSAQAWLEKYL